MSFSIRSATGIALMVVGASLLIGSTTYAMAQSSGPPQAPPTISALAPPQGPVTPELTAAQQAKAIDAATKDSFVSNLISSQHVTVADAKAVPWQHGNGVGIGVAVRLTLSSPITIPAGHPSIVFGPAEVASAKGYRAETSPVRIEQAPGLVVFIDGGSGTVAGIQPLLTPGGKTAFFAPPGYVYPQSTDD